MGISLIVHVGLVSVTLGTGLITAIYRYLAYKNNDIYLETFARRAFRLLAVTELFSGVWGTVITVVMAGFFTGLFAMFANVLFTPIVIALIGIMIRIPAIAAFWYTWGRIDPFRHSILGFVMALSGFMIPLGFRALMSDITVPTAIGSFLDNRPFGAFDAYFSSLYWNLYLHTVLAVISVGGFMVVSIMALDGDAKGVKIAAPYAFIPLMLQFVIGPLYLLQLHFEAPYVFNALVRVDQLLQGSGGLFTPAFAVKVISALALLWIGTKIYSDAKKGVINPYAKYGGFLAIFVAVAGEIVNSGSRYPYMVVLDSGGKRIEEYFNYYINIGDVFPAVVVILLFLVLSLVVFTVAAYYALIRKFVA
ncbi:MAG: cytochrome ubiquinol oxidase subunit I [Acidilobaceae archaeon]|nr:cytochrome ubiquinol oxidase subunit I [Acidilobaceae archaeon]MCX8165423.1 cytochrome ubiquinol oxidase subunit I [Acidilobaceae archaeon]MDW7973850.1 cytochrome ubiquinol oxidase subunit I [Sulfolobales archaeon]